MRDFVDLVVRLDKTNRTKEKIAYLELYLKSAPQEDLIWVIALFTHRRPRGVIKLALLKSWAMEVSGLPEWLFQESYHYVGDLAETLSLLGNISAEKAAALQLIGNDAVNFDSLGEVFEKMLWIKNQEEEHQKRWVLAVWHRLNAMERFVFNKLLTGGFRIGVSEQLLFKAIATVENMSVLDVQHRLMGNWVPTLVSYAELLRGDGNNSISNPFPFALCYALDENLESVSVSTLEFSLGSVRDWQLEWKWDGIRAQLVYRQGQGWLWSRGEELINDSFPELQRWLTLFTEPIVLDGELLVWQGHRPGTFQEMQRRLGRKRIGKKLLVDCPVVFMVYDLLELGGEDLRGKCTVERRQLLEGVFSGFCNYEEMGLRLSPVFSVSGWLDAMNLRSDARLSGTEGLMLKHRDSKYEGGRKRGQWWKWKVEPETVDCVLIYVQRGHGKRASLYTDFTFAVRDGEDGLVPFAKAYSGLTNAELKEINLWLKNHTRESFGPVRSVDAELVFEVAFEGIAKSSRHKSGIAVRFPRIVRWRKDKTVAEIDTLDNILIKLENGRQID